MARQTAGLWLLLVSLAALTGCSKGQKAGGPAAPTVKPSTTPGKASDLGEHRAVLTADGELLHVFFETNDGSPRPVGITGGPHQGLVQFSGDDSGDYFWFQAAPEQPPELPAGYRTHFVGKSASLKNRKPGVMFVTMMNVRLPDGQERNIQWRNFVPEEHPYKKR